MPWGGASRRGGDNTSITRDVTIGMCSRPPSYAHPLPSGRARYGPRPLSLLPQLSLHVTPASQVSATSDKPLALGHRYRSLDSTTTPLLYCGGSGQDGDDESGVDLSPRDGDLLFLTVRRGSHRTRPDILLRYTTGTAAHTFELVPTCCVRFLRTVGTKCKV